VDGLFALPRQLLENGPARRIGKSAEHVICISRRHTQNHNQTVMVCQDQLFHNLQLRTHRTARSIYKRQFSKNQETRRNWRLSGQFLCSLIAHNE
jgi:hypothetical protein